MAVDQPHGNPLAQPFDLAPHIGLHAGQRGRAVEPERKELLLVNAVARIGLDVLHKGATGVELESGVTHQLCTFGGLEASAHL